MRAGHGLGHAASPSRARGSHRPDSDADLATILGGKPGARYDLAIEMAGIAFDVMLETGVLVEALPIWETEWADHSDFQNPALIGAIRRGSVSA